MKAFSKQALKEIEEIIGHYPQKRAALLQVLHIAQREFGYIDEEVERTVASLLEIPPVQVHEVVTFYTMYKRKPMGRYHIQVCRNLTCTLMGAESVLSYLMKKLKIRPGEVTPDGKFSLETVECLGACEMAPVMQINFDYYGNLTPEKIDEILEKLK